MGVGGQLHTPAALFPGKTRYPLYRRLGGPQGRSGQVRKLSPPLGFNPWTVQPIASHYTNCAIPAQPTTDYMITFTSSFSSLHVIRIWTLLVELQDSSFSSLSPLPYVRRSHVSVENTNAKLTKDTQ